MTWNLPPHLRPKGLDDPWHGPCWSEADDGRIIVSRLYQQTARNLGIEIDVYRDSWFLVSQDDAVRIRSAYEHPHVRRERELQAAMAAHANRIAFAAREWAESERGKRQAQDHANIVALLPMVGLEVSP